MTDLKIKVIQTSTSKLGCQVALASSADITVSSADKSVATDDDLLARIESREAIARVQMPPTASTNQSPGQLKSLGALPPSCSQKGAPISRLIMCDTPQALKYLGALAKTEKAKFILVVKTDPRYGGSGGQYPVITTGSPAAMAEHELMHQLGFADEYTYTTPCEADIYCADKSNSETSPSGYGSLPGTSFNVAAFNARSSYSSNTDVRSAHGSLIPWLDSIAASTDLTQAGQLGSAPKTGEVGLFRGGVCDKASRRIDTWLSTSDATVMKTLSTTLIPQDYWPTISKSLGTHLKK